MADILAGESYVPRETRVNREGLAQRVLVIVIVALSLILAGELVYHLVIAPRLRIETISIESDLSLSDEELLSLAGLSTGAAFFSVDGEAAAARLREFPLVRDAQV
ncbi:MAG TPA: FtsQ-type POTRA domain-containing protein, partial [Spirochaetia bacterium]|nr:FtsQ-type POTRA domain-containing protein [Spirochaetia bacterium]